MIIREKEDGKADHSLPGGLWISFGDKQHWLSLGRSRVRLQWIACLSVRVPSGGCIVVKLEVQIPQEVFEDICI